MEYLMAPMSLIPPILSQISGGRKRQGSLYINLRWLDIQKSVTQSDKDNSRKVTCFLKSI